MKRIGNSKWLFYSQQTLMYQHSYTSLLRNFDSFQIAIRGLKIRVSDLLAILRLTMLGAVIAQFPDKNLTRAVELAVSSYLSQSTRVLSDSQVGRV